ncbi:MAG: hypothetical protein PHF79_02005 [Candidatus Pacebacteria bacterium]|nr:hypothetical protein [Candidatus Paceibacterota bacterium]
MSPRFLFGLSFSILAVSVYSFVQPIQAVFAQSADTTVVCDTEAQKAVCRAQLQQLENDIANVSSQLQAKQSEGASIQRDISILDLQIKQAQLKIQAHQLAIKKLGNDITVKTNTINALTDQIGHGQDSLARIISQTQQLDDYSLQEAFLSGGDLSTFYVDLDAYASIDSSLKNIIDSVRTAKGQNEQAKQQLDQQRNQEIDIEVNVETEKKKIVTAQNSKKELLALNKNQQKSYQSVLSDKQAQAAKIRNALFALRDAAAIPFGDAVTYAQTVANKTGVRAAFVLAIIQQESNLGSNVGSCYLADQNGNGTKVSNGAAVSNVMKPGRDVEPFIALMSQLGRDPYHTRVSCPFTTGYGGAMGPAQFIASTWALNVGRLQNALNVSVPDPWRPLDAFMAAALYMEDLGAVGGSYTAERNAACRYYSGRTCSGSNKFYGDQVMAKATDIQGNIDILQGS